MWLHCVLATTSLQSRYDHGDATAFLRQSCGNSLRCYGTSTAIMEMPQCSHCTALLVHWKHHKTKSNISGGTPKVVIVVGGIFKPQPCYQHVHGTINCPCPGIVMSNPSCALVPFFDATTLYNTIYNTIYTILHNLH